MPSTNVDLELTKGSTILDTNFWYGVKKLEVII